MKTEMIHINNDGWIGFFAGMLGGFIKYVSGSLLDVSFGARLVEAGTTALVCGFLGVAGKHLFTWAKKKFINKKIKP